MKILVTDSISEDGIEHLRRQPDLEVAYQSDLSPDDLLSEIRDADALIVRSKTKVTSDVIEAAQRLRVIGRAGAGVDNIDQEAATRKGVVVMNTPGGNSVSVAEHAFALVLSLARKIPFAHASLRSGNWDKSGFVGQELQNKTLGIVGLGKIGALLSQRAQAFHMKVIAFDPFVSEEHAAGLGVQLTTLDDLLSQSDFVSLHLPLNETTKGLIDADALKSMKEGAFLINTSRGGTGSGGGPGGRSGERAFGRRRPGCVRRGTRNSLLPLVFGPDHRYPSHSWIHGGGTVQGGL